MANLQIYDPFADNGDRRGLFRGFFRRSGLEKAAPASARVDVTETDKGYTCPRRNPRRQEGRHRCRRDRRQPGDDLGGSEAQFEQKDGERVASHRTLRRAASIAASRSPAELDETASEAKVRKRRSGAQAGEEAGGCGSQADPVTPSRSLPDRRGSPGSRPFAGGRPRSRRLRVASAAHLTASGVPCIPLRCCRGNSSTAKTRRKSDATPPTARSGIRTCLTSTR